MMNHTATMPRRRFLAAGAAALGVAPMFFTRSFAESVNDQIAIGVIGCGGMGGGLMGNFLNMSGVRVTAVCDVDQNMRDRAKKRVDEHYENTDCKAHGHYRELLSQNGLDAVVIATPDHMHAQIGIEAASAGLDIYGEKPFTWGLAEGRQLVDALKENKRVWQTGSQQRSGNHFRQFKALIEHGAIGKVKRVECGTPRGMSIRNHSPAEEWESRIGNPPSYINWEAYCGVVGEFPYHPMLHPWNWRWHETFGGGQLLDWVGHHVDIAMWALGLDRTGPVTVEGTGKHGDHEFFNALVDYQYQGKFADGTLIEVRTDFGGTRITGEDGWLHVNRGKLDADDRERLRNLPDDFDDRPPGHQQDFINCVRSRETPVADAESTHRASSFGQLALAAIESGRVLRWDPEAERVIDDVDLAAHPRLGSRVVL